MYPSGALIWLHSLRDAMIAHRIVVQRLRLGALGPGLILHVDLRERDAAVARVGDALFEEVLMARVILVRLRAAHLRVGSLAGFHHVQTGLLSCRPALVLWGASAQRVILGDDVPVRVVLLGGRGQEEQLVAILHLCGTQGRVCLDELACRVLVHVPVVGGVAIEVATMPALGTEIALVHPKVHGGMGSCRALLRTFRLEASSSPEVHRHGHLLAVDDHLGLRPVDSAMNLNPRSDLFPSVVLAGDRLPVVGEPRKPVCGAVVARHLAPVPAARRLHDQGLVLEGAAAQGHALQAVS